MSSSIRRIFSTSLSSPSPAMDTATKLIADHPVMVFSKSWCGYSRRSKQILDNLGAEYKVIELDLEGDGPKIQNALAEMTGQSTVPNIFIGKEHIGGCDDLARLFASDKKGLQARLQAAGAFGGAAPQAEAGPAAPATPTPESPKSGGDL